MKSIPITAGSKYTLFTVSSSAMTERKEVIVISVSDTPEFRPRYNGSQSGKYRIGTYKTGRKHEQFHLDIDLNGTLVIPGWERVILCDHEKHGSFAMSATLNLAATPEAIRDMLTKNINPHFERYELIVAYPVPLDSSGKESGIIVYPESPNSHAVIQQMRDAQS
jgi:hypothetical protein